VPPHRRLPDREAARVALRAILDYLQRNRGALDLVRFVLFTESDHKVYAEALAELTEARK